MIVSCAHVLFVHDIVSWYGDFVAEWCGHSLIENDPPAGLTVETSMVEHINLNFVVAGTRVCNA